MKLRILFLLFLGIQSCKSPEARYPVSQKSGSYIDESIALNKKMIAEEEEEITQVIEADAQNEYLNSEDGFWYYYNSKTTDSLNIETPEFGDVVVFDYSVFSINGQPIYGDGVIPTREYAIDQENLFTGLRQGLKLMKEGETLTFLFPSHKAFGYYGDQKKIGRNVPINVKVTLLDIKEETTNQTTN